MEENNGGCDTSGFTGTNNIYCQDCERQYEVRGVTVFMCCYCGSVDVLEKDEEDISAIQSELAKEASKKLRSEAPWILGGDE